MFFSTGFGAILVAIYFAILISIPIVIVFFYL
jgi:hypothetical protein